ncbi:ANKDD1A [Symbiodinium sp. CCMP2592]|nr:ANKDD1A [Symbiodinium sp. CCMP2592]
MLSCALPLSCSAPEPATPLEAYARDLQDCADVNACEEQLFAMYVVPVESLFEMTEVVPHETLLLEEKLVEFDEALGNAMFISHQWAGVTSPDPDFQQFKVLQDVLRRKLRPGASITGFMQVELYTGQLHRLPAEEISSKPLFVWYDYFSCPQRSASARENAIRSIPAYVGKCRYFVILCPPVWHAGQGTFLSKRSWECRGWCRFERAVRELSRTGSTGLDIEIISETHQTVEPTMAFQVALTPVFEGQFSVEADRNRIVEVLKRMIRRKMAGCLVEADFHEYRLQRNFQRVYFRNFPIGPIDDFLPEFVSDTRDPASFMVAAFLYQNGFRSIHERSLEGWTPICFAALDGTAMLMAALLEQRADANDCITRGESRFHLAAGTPVLHMCACFKNNEAMKVLINKRCEVNGKDGYGSTALHWAGITNNVEGIQVLFDAGCLPAETNMIGYSAFRITSTTTHVDAVQALLPRTSRQEITIALHDAVLLGGGSARIVCALIEAGADVDYQLKTEVSSPMGLMMAYFSLRHRWSQSTLSTYAYHHYQATPLMCSVITSSFEATAILLAAGARLDLRNARGLTAADLAKEVSAPDHVVASLEGSKEAVERLTQDVADFVKEYFLMTTKSF